MFQIYACNNPNKATYIDFPEVSDIQAIRNITLDSIILAYPIIKRNEEYLCVADKDAKNQYFHLSTYPEFRYIKSFGTRVRGHNEILSLIDFDIYDNHLYALSNHQIVYIYNLLTDSLLKMTNIHDVISPISINIINL